MTSSLFDPMRTRKKSRGFTIAELMIAITIGSFVLAGVLSTFLMVIRSGMRASNYSMMEAQTRRAFEQLGIDARMAKDFTTVFTAGEISSFTLEIPNLDLSQTTFVTYGFDDSDATNKKIFRVPGANPAATAGRLNLVTNVENVQFLRFKTNNVLIPAGTVSNTGLKHIQISVSVKRQGVGLAAATQIIRSSAFTLRNISL